jgi:hypothetical protein
VIDFDAFAADCRLRGRLDLTGPRMTDLLNAAPGLTVVDARLESLEDGHEVQVPEVVVERSDLCAVAGTGPRGDESRRLHTNSVRVGIDVPPYRVEGYLHSTPASDPLGAVLRRSPWVPLTDAVIRWARGTETREERRDVLIVNREQVVSMRPIVEELALLPGEVARARPAIAAGTPDPTHATRATGVGTTDEDDRPP